MRIAWFSFFPIEWLPNLPPELLNLPRMHPASWQRVLWEELQGRPNLELDILVVRSQFHRSMTFQRGNTRFHCLRTPPGSRASTLYWMDTLLIRRALRRLQPQLVHAWGTEFAAATVAARLNYPALVTVQGILTWLGEHFPLNRHQKISRLLEPSSLRRAKHATCESSFAMDYLGSRYPQLRLRQIEHAPHPMFAALDRRPVSSRLVCMGPFIEAKGAAVVLRALNLLPGANSLLWIGARNPELESRLRAEIRPEIWERITFKHNLTAAEVSGELSSATLFVHGALADNSPNSVKEAVVAGVPVVATRTGGIPDYVFPGRNGFLFASGDAADCAEQLQAALTHPEFSRGAVDAETLRKVRDYLSAATMADRFLETYKIVAS